MKKKLTYLILIFALFGVIIGIRYIYLKMSDNKGRIKITSSPSANIILDNKPIGKTPFEDDFKEGEYFLKLIPNQEEASESASWNGKVKIYRNTLTFVSRELGSNDISSSGVLFSITKMAKKPVKKNTGEIEIKTEPDGSIVYLDNEEQGIAPLVLSEIPDGDHELSVYNPGFFRRSQKVKVKTGYRIIAEYKLAIDPTHKKIVKEGLSEATNSASLSPTPSKVTSITINETETGWLRVRYEPTLSASEAAKVNPGEKYSVLDEREGWYKITYETGKIGWVSSRYVTKHDAPSTAQ